MYVNNPNTLLLRTPLNGCCSPRSRRAASSTPSNVCDGTPGVGESRSSIARSRAAAASKTVNWAPHTACRPALVSIWWSPWRVFHLMMLAREMPDLPCTVYFTDEEWKALCCYTTESPLSPKQPPSLDSATRMVGAMGGHLGRKRDGPPGAQTLWRGLQRLEPAAKVYRILTTGPPLHASGP